MTPGTTLVHTVKAFKNYTAAEIAAFPLINGVPSISLIDSEHDAAGTTASPCVGVFGGAYFTALGFNAASGQLVQTSDPGLCAYDPFTGANKVEPFGPPAFTGFADGLDVDGGNVWWSPDVGSIFLNGPLFIDNGDLTKTTLPGWSGLGGEVGLGWSGVEQVAGSLFAVAVQDGSDVGRSRTIVRFDAATGDLLGFDPDGDPVAARWEDLAFDGEFLYAADLRGDADGDGVPGDIYVFEVSGGLSPEICDDGIDNDGDGLIDGADPDCAPTNNPPVCDNVVPNVSELWPPNHKFHLVSFDGATDPDGDPVVISITGVTQDEPLTGQGTGNTKPDATLGPPRTRLACGRNALDKAMAASTESPSPRLTTKALCARWCVTSAFLTISDREGWRLTQEVSSIP